MKKNSATKGLKVLLFVLLMSLNYSVFGQVTKTGVKTTIPAQKKSSDFWNHVQFGGGIGGGIGNQYSNLYVAPSAIYNFNAYFSAGTGLQMSYSDLLKKTLLRLTMNYNAKLSEHFYYQRR